MGDVANCKLGYFTQWNDAEHSTADNASSVPYYLQCHITRTYYQRETVSERPIRQPLSKQIFKGPGFYEWRNEFAFIEMVRNKSYSNYQSWPNPSFNPFRGLHPFRFIFYRYHCGIYVNGSQLAKMKRYILYMSLLEN